MAVLTHKTPEYIPAVYTHICFAIKYFFFLIPSSGLKKKKKSAILLDGKSLQPLAKLTLTEVIKPHLNRQRIILLSNTN